MPETRNKKSEGNEAKTPETRKKPSEVTDSKEEYITRSTLKHIMDAQERMFKSFIDSIVVSMTARVDGLVNTVAELKSSLEYTQKDLDDLKPVMTEINSVQQDIEFMHETLTNQTDKMEYLENQSRRNNIRVVGIPEDVQETWETTEAKVKEVLKSKLKLETPVEIERAHRVGRHTTAQNGSSPPKPRTIVCKLKNWKQKEIIVRTARKAKVPGIFIFDDIAKETRKKQLDQQPQLIAAKQAGKIAYFVMDKLVIKNRVNQSPVRNPQKV